MVLYNKLMKENINLKDICSIIVFYDFDLKNFEKNLKRQIYNFKNIIIVNNSPSININNLKSNKVKILNNKKNLGATGGLNKGIIKAKKLGFKMVALFDQDTFLPRNFSKKMLHYINKYKKFDNAAVFAPIYKNMVTKKWVGGFTLEFLMLKIKKPNKSLEYSCGDFVISSGSFIPIKIINNVGLLNNKLFMDYFDKEWCMRAKKKGYLILNLNKISIKHYIGNYSIKFLGINHFVISPIRNYFYFRNYAFLLKSKNLSLNWKFTDSIRNFFVFLFYLFLVRKNKKEHLYFILKGIFDGFKNKMGNLKN